MAPFFFIVLLKFVSYISNTGITLSVVWIFSYYFIRSNQKRLKKHLCLVINV